MGAMLGAWACSDDDRDAGGFTHSNADELTTCIEGRWTIAPEQPGDVAASLEWLPRSMVVYHVRRSMLEVLTTTGETIEEKPFTLEARDRRHGWLDVQGGGRVEVGSDESCGVLTLMSEGGRFELRRASQ